MTSSGSKFSWKAACYEYLKASRRKAKVEVDLGIHRKEIPTSMKYRTDACPQTR
jgi:hypothetical protein